MEPTPLTVLTVAPIVFGALMIYLSFAKEVKKFKKEKELVKEEKEEDKGNTPQ